jgi:peptidoglycan/LPS O-acetylase OafA/YrhL
MAGTEPASAVGHTRGAGPLELAYRPHLDGLRAFAVYLVVLFHAGVDRFDGGFIGVDVFFVLSGYIVTQVLLRDVETSGTIGLRRFYSRRFRRLLPAAFVTLLVTAAVFSAIASPAEVADAVDAVRAAFLYVANWFFIGQATDYWGADIEASPVLHFWSLAIEEQFYLCWPLLLLAAVRVTRRFGARQWDVVRVAVGVGAVASLVAALRISSTDLARAYYGTDTRAYQLLAGALLALSFSALLRRQALRRAVGVAGIPALLALVVLATPAVDVEPIERGIVTVVLAGTLIASIDAAPRSLAARALSVAPVVYLGRISYGTYLWHWLVVIVVVRTFDVTPVATAGITFLVATGLASLSYQLLERPVREWRALDRARGPVIAAGLAISVVSAVLIVPAVMEDDDGAQVAVGASGSQPVAGTGRVDGTVDWRAAVADRPDFPDCIDADPERCTIVDGDGPHVLLMGDSHARMFVPTFERIAREHNLRLSTTIRPVCPWQRGLQLGEEASECARHQEDWYGRIIPALDPDVVVAIHRPIDDPADPVDISTADGVPARFGDEYQRAIRDATVASVDELAADGREIVIFEPTPATTDLDPIACLSEEQGIAACRFVASEEPKPLERTYREIAEQRDDVTALDVDRLVCPYLPICDPVLDGMVVFRDDTHITGSFATSLADEIWAALRDNGVVDGG